MAWRGVEVPGAVVSCFDLGDLGEVVDWNWSSLVERLAVGFWIFDLEVR
jgi:hypothetical protein